MEATGSQHLARSVLAQAEVRLKLGFVVLALMITTALVWGTSLPVIGPVHVANL